MNNESLKKLEKEILKILETNEIENTPYKNLWNKPKAVSKGNILIISAYTKNIKTLKKTIV